MAKEDKFRGRACCIAFVVWRNISFNVLFIIFKIAAISVGSFQISVSFTCSLFYFSPPSGLPLLKISMCFYSYRDFEKTHRECKTNFIDVTSGINWYFRRRDMKRFDIFYTFSAVLNFAFISKQYLLVMKFLLSLKRTMWR